MEMGPVSILDARAHQLRLAASFLEDAAALLEDKANALRRGDLPALEQGVGPNGGAIDPAMAQEQQTIFCTAARSIIFVVASGRRRVARPENTPDSPADQILDDDDDDNDNNHNNNQAATQLANEGDLTDSETVNETEMEDVLDGNTLTEDSEGDEDPEEDGDEDEEMEDEEEEEHTRLVIPADRWSFREEGYAMGNGWTSINRPPNYHD
jgi:hypothetical protein